MKSVELPAADANDVISSIKAARTLMFSFHNQRINPLCIFSLIGADSGAAGAFRLLQPVVDLRSVWLSARRTFLMHI
jgi:hypothetical protein